MTHSSAERAEAMFASVARWMFGEPMAELLADVPDHFDPIFADEAPAPAPLSEERTDILRRAFAVEKAASEVFNHRAGGRG